MYIIDKCILEQFICDGDIDCGGKDIDSSDEDPELCTKDSECHAGYTACRDGTCVRTELHCDGHLDCKDQSDEGMFCESQAHKYL